ncbi:AAA family ATPase [Micromonospora sp. NPDC018662]|uniref:AAA family ATPase n=1 Tax=Micromonospora sp. NPDC018662 TaxID=3364238 RepID=UPI00379774C1
MRLKTMSFNGFKRFTQATIGGLPSHAKLIVLAGPNGSGKSSIFDGLKTWHWANGAPGMNWDETYGTKVGTASISWPQHVQVSFHEPLPEGADRKKLIYVRSAFRNEADFNVSSFNRLASPLDAPKVSRLIDNDASVSDNYQRLIMATIDGVYSDSVPDDMTKAELRGRIIGKVQEAMMEVFPDLQLTGVGGVGAAVDAGTFYFAKGSVNAFLYKNLSAGEKAAFDLLLDLVVKREYFDNTIWCIDEPETHLNTRVQAKLLRAMLHLLPEACQLILASHSIGFMSEAWKMAKEHPGSVAFIDLQGVDFDQPVILRPIAPSRDFWARTLDVALGDLAELVAPAEIVLCEGRPVREQRDRKAEFDASCYRRIFASEFPNVDFMSVGNSYDASVDRLEIGRTIQAIATGTKVVRLIDRDHRSLEEVRELEAGGVKVLGRRHIESYLLDDEVIAALCGKVDQEEKITDALAVKAGAIRNSIARNNDPDDMKSAAGEVFVGLRRLLVLTKAGSDWVAFARDTLAPLIGPEMQVYRELKEEIFGDIAKAE